VEANYFAFRLLDGDRDGELHGRDIADCYQNVLPSSCPASSNYKGQKLAQRALKKAHAVAKQTEKEDHEAKV
jgi:hypothetical protein